MVNKPKTLWGFPIVEVDTLPVGTVKFGPLPSILEIKMHEKIFQDTPPLPGLIFTLEDHPLFKNKVFTILKPVEHLVGQMLLVTVREEDIS